MTGVHRNTAASISRDEHYFIMSAVNVPEEVLLVQYMHRPCQQHQTCSQFGGRWSPRVPFAKNINLLVMEERGEANGHYSHVFFLSSSQIPVPASLHY